MKKLTRTKTFFQEKKKSLINPTINLLYLTINNECALLQIQSLYTQKNKKNISLLLPYSDMIQISYMLIQMHRYLGGHACVMQVKNLICSFLLPKGKKKTNHRKEQKRNRVDLKGQVILKQAKTISKCLMTLESQNFSSCMHLQINLINLLLLRWLSLRKEG